MIHWNVNSLTDVKIGSADTTGFHFDQDIIVSDRWQRYSNDAIVLWLGVSRMDVSQRLDSRLCYIQCLASCY